MLADKLGRSHVSSASEQMQAELIDIDYARKSVRIETKDELKQLKCLNECVKISIDFPSPVNDEDVRSERRLGGCVNSEDQA